jgi:hypothetical protein
MQRAGIVNNAEMIHRMQIALLLEIPQNRAVSPNARVALLEISQQLTMLRLPHNGKLCTLTGWAVA